MVWWGYGIVWVGLIVVSLFVFKLFLYCVYEWYCVLVIFLVLFILVVFNGLILYLEIKIGFGWNMYSNFKMVVG